MKNILLFISVFTIILFLLLILRREFFGENEDIKMWENLVKDTEYVPKVNKNKKSNILIVFEDYNCPDCKRFNNEILNSSNLLEKHNIEVRNIEMSFLGEHSLKSSVAAYAVNHFAPGKYETFHNELLNKKTTKNSDIDVFLNRKFDTLDIQNELKIQIKKGYKNKKSEFWDNAEKDKYISDKYNIKYSPTVYFNGKEIKNLENKVDFEKEISPLIHKEK
ncbi:hypothetical protein AST00_06565 [Staphylococcus equorum]|uniref:DsbA family protein n=1 Tax=Staphylococcus equorum TaxID=246432 RepID=UPI00085299EF|nr:thioredoxin domain-containing protein [Staphylococcus equorum]OEK67322.1 hypothetical protein AST00_06565 [Staphylococcus equorum]OEK68579.1 hypothetical protein AST02_08045 [Staphylococcus equorum]